MEAWARIELAYKSFADSCLTTWLPRRNEGTEGLPVNPFGPNETGAKHHTEIPPRAGLS